MIKWWWNDLFGILGKFLFPRLLATISAGHLYLTMAAPALRPFLN